MARAGTCCRAVRRGLAHHEDLEGHQGAEDPRASRRALPDQHVRGAGTGLRPHRHDDQERHGRAGAGPAQHDRQVARHRQSGRRLLRLQGSEGIRRFRRARDRRGDRRGHAAAGPYRRHLHGDRGRRHRRRGQEADRARHHSAGRVDRALHHRQRPEDARFASRPPGDPDDHQALVVGLRPCPGRSQVPNVVGGNANAGARTDSHAAPLAHEGQRRDPGQGRHDRQPRLRSRPPVSGPERSPARRIGRAQALHQYLRQSGGHPVPAGQEDGPEGRRRGVHRSGHRRRVGPGGALDGPLARAPHVPAGPDPGADRVPAREGLRHRHQHPPRRREGRPRLDRARARGRRRGARARREVAQRTRGPGGSDRARRDCPVVEISRRVQSFTESVIREMTRVVDQVGGVNLAQGMPNFLPPRELIAAAHRAIDGDFHQYAVTWGAPSLRQAIAGKYRAFYGMDVDADRHVTVCCGSTETMLSTLLAVLNPGDEVIIFEPFYENYGPGCIISGAVPVFVPLEPPEFSFDPDRLRRAVTPRTRAIVFNSPNNPTGKVFSRGELQAIADLCLAHDLLAITDEIYEHIVYDGLGHTPIATLPGMAERTVTISGISKSYSVTGWRVGYAVANPELSVGIRRAHDFITVGAPHVLQEAAVTALGLPDAYYVSLRQSYQARRDLLFGKVQEAGFVAWEPKGAYYILTDVAHFMERHGCQDDHEFAMFLIKNIGVATVPGSSFYAHGELGRTKIRFCFPKTDDLLIEAGSRLQKLVR